MSRGHSRTREGIELVSEQARPLLAVILTVLLVTSPVVAAVPAGALTQAGNAGNTGTGAGNTGIGTGAGNTAVTPDPVVGSASPTDPNGDGRFEDVNGDGSFDVVDSQALLAHLTNASVQNYSSSFDFTGDGRVTVSDGQWLYVQAVNPTETDADGDGLNNTVEIALGTNAFDTDTDSDGIGDWTETNGGKPIDTDSDGIIDARDADSDGDRIPDIREGTKDTDGDGTPNYRDTDDDGDGITTRTEALDGQNYSHDVDFDETVNWLDTDADGDGAPDGTEGTADSDGDGMPDYLDNDRDNDGLPDSYERNVTKTDPADNDSESPLTNYTEADNDVIDGMEDFDQDTLGTYVEYAIGTDPFVSDTDDDGLSDGFEYRNDQFNPLDADTDGDGTSDASGDLDGDGLTNGEEAQRGTLVDRPDTDGDSLNDSREIELGTDPTLPDTDADGLDDDEELAIGTDPLNNDSDGDGVLDGNETFETAMDSESTGATVTLRTNGSGADVTMEAKPDFFENTSASAGPTIQLENRTAFENATVELPVDASVPESEYENLSIYTWNGSSKDTWSKVETTIENGTAKATVEHFSYFTVLDTDEWVSATQVSIGEPVDFNASDSFRCRNACNLTGNSTVVLGGEPTTRKITIEQGGDSYEVVPLSNGQTIEKFYDYANAEINSPLPVAKSDTSRLFFWSGPNGLSLVLLQDKPRDGSGAAVSFELYEFPISDGSWVVRDDPGDNYGTTPDWSWNDDNTDGGAFRGELTNATFTIKPRFNEEAVRDPITPGQLNDWEVLSGRATDPTNESLAIDQNITISVPGDPDENASSNVSGDTGSANITDDLTSGTDDLVVVYQTEQTNTNPAASIEVTGASGTTVSKDLAIGTVGTVQTTVNVSTLAHGPANISLSADGVNMRAEVVPRETFDSDGDGIPDSVENQNWTLPTAAASTFSTDPYDADTDGDGIPDGEEVIYKTNAENGTLTTTIAVANSDPTEVNSDGDELTDLEENRGWNTYLARSPSTAEQFVSARQNGGDALGVLWKQNVSSDPLSTDTDGDLLDDHEERRLGTSPTVADSDNDGSDDYYEVSNDYDPTIHDHKAPLVEPLEVSADNTARTSYTARVSVSDQSGISRIEFYKAGSRQWSGLGDGATARTFDASIEVERDALDAIYTGATGFFTPVTVDASATDIHGNRKRKELSGPDTFGQAADKYASFPASPGKGGFVAWMGLSSGASTVVGESVAGVAQMVSDPGGYASQMAQLATTIANNPAIITKLPQMMASQLRQQHETRNPFDSREQYYQEFGGGWSLGYSTGTVAPAFASGGSSVLQKGLSSSSKLRRLVDAADSAVPSRVPNGVKPTALRRAGKVDDSVPDADVPTGRMSAKLNDMPGPKRQRTTEQFDQLDSDGSDYLGNTDINDPTLKATDLFENTGPSGRRALNDLAESDQDAADALLQMDDAATQRRFTEAYESGEVDSDELTTALTRYDSLDADGKRFADDAIERTGTDGPDLMSTDVCNSPCHGTIRAVYEYTDEADGLSDSQAKDVLQSYDAADEVDVGPGRQGPGAAQERVDSLANDNVEGVQDMLEHAQGNTKSFKEIAGETDIAKKIRDEDNGIEASKLHMQKTSRGVSGGPNSNTEIDVKVDGELTVNGRNLESPAIESKHLSAAGKSDWLIENREVPKLTDKLKTQVADDEDTLVVVTTDEYRDRLDDMGLLSEIRNDVQSHSSSSDVTVEFTTYSEL
ncbi:dockerin type I domain-containing protein [Haloarcula sp. CBA1122]|uniref:dockerin type I domain-containing protein n=1 Tax=Haloarcula sp. CBA1122 TaxID=2668069 RepID=UPI0020919ADC|nr:dockerin type I domain-containing protein [Haloarcula sp. CBA1122]